MEEKKLWRNQTESVNQFSSGQVNEENAAVVWPVVDNWLISDLDHNEISSQ